MTRAKRGRPNRIDGFPAEIRDLILGLIRDGVTQADIRRRLERPLEDIGERPLSAGGLNRWVSVQEDIARDFRETRAISEAFRAQPGEEPTGEIGQLTAELLKIQTFRSALRVRRMLDEDEALIPQALLKELATGLERLERSAATGVKRERELRAEYDAKLRAQREQDAAAVEATARDSGQALSREFLLRVRREVYGIHDDA